MASRKAHPERVSPRLVEMAVESGKDLQALYSQCVAISFRTTGRMAPGFDNVDLIAFIRGSKKYSVLFNESGKRIPPPEKES